MAKKLILDIDEETWKEVQKYKIDQKLANNNQTVVTLIKKGLGTESFANKVPFAHKVGGVLIKFQKASKTGFQAPLSQ